MDSPKLLVGSAYGVYMPQTFIRFYGDQISNRDELQEELEVCNQDPNELSDTQFFWDCWSLILDSAEIDGKVLVLDEDLWLVDPEQAQDWQYR